ncbi:MAG: YciI family protein [Marinibacterium sp.]|nr:YciI family protein [Marinibacterium sp.]
MPRFMYVFHGGSTPESPAAQEAAMAAWGAWFAEMGDAVLDGGGPAGLSKTVSADGITDDGGANPVSGLTIVEAADQQAACEMAKGCPMVRDGTGSVEVAEIIQM